MRKRFSFFSLLERQQRREARVLLLLMLVGMVLEMMGIGLVVPVISILMQSGNSELPPVVSTWYDYFGLNSHKEVIFAALVLLLAVYLFKSIFLSYLASRRARFAYGLQAELATRLYTIYLSQPYSFHLERNSAQLIRNASGELSMLTTQVVLPSLQLIAEGLVMVGLLLLLMTFEPVGTAVVLTILIVFVSLFYRFFQKRLGEWGRRRQHHEGMRIQHLQQGLGSIKEVKLLGREHDFIENFSKAAKGSSRAIEKQAALIQLPGLWLEFLAVVGLVALVSTMLSLGREPSAIVPTLGLFTAAAFRLMPSANRLLVSLQQIQYGSTVIDLLQKELSLASEHPLNQKTNKRISFKDRIRIQNVTFSYEGARGTAIEDLSLEILRNESIGIFGPSGSGKSTTVDLLLGLVQAKSGHILVDGKDILSDLRGWQNLIGYVPQTIYLIDSSLRNNIALGVPDSEIKEQSIRSALEMAQLVPFVNSLPEGLDTQVGEQGVRLSGGQRQRIGIARALYHDPEILFFDEATSALDAATEKEVMEAVSALRGNKTLVMVAHRLSSLSQCDRLFELDNGRLVRTITPKELAASKDQSQATI